jgi:aminoglycoside phosphotransferase (APT) family kinase protein
VELPHGGRSTLTYEVTDGTHRWVLRRPPLGVLTPTAHDMDREYRVVGALGGTGVLVARAVLSYTDPAVIGAPVCVVDFVEGSVLRDGDEVAALPRAHARRSATVTRSPHCPGPTHAAVPMRWWTLWWHCTRSTSALSGSAASADPTAI